MEYKVAYSKYSFLIKEMTHEEPPDWKCDKDEHTKKLQLEESS